MAARATGHGLKQTPARDSSLPEDNESENPPEEERRESRAQNYCGFSLQGIFRLALTFFKEMNGKAFNPTYEENLLFAALQKQISHGPYNPQICPEVGFFDVLGNDRRKKWSELGSTTKEDAMEDFVKLLISCCSLFSPYVTSHKIEKEEHEKRIREAEERFRLETEERHRQEEEQRLAEEKSSQQKPQVTVALNAQTPAQQYTEQQLFTQKSQEQHNVEFIQQVHLTHHVKQQQHTAEAPSSASNDFASESNPISHSESSQRIKSDATPKQCHLFIESKSGGVPVIAPSMWTTPQVNEFKEKTQQDSESVITVGRGEVLTVHIPTHDDGSTFCWEFATDGYDIAFGLYFEWPEEINGHQTEANQKSEKKTKNVVSEVVPLFRRDSHENVYAGSHQYPSQGVYLLRFDNSYSLWRSKVVYYRVYYTS